MAVGPRSVRHDTEGIGFFRYTDDLLYYANTPAQANDGYHIVGVYEDETLKLFVNGESRAFSGGGAVSMAAFVGQLSLGSNSNHSDDLDGYIAEAAVYDHALSADRVRAHYLAVRGP